MWNPSPTEQKTGHNWDHFKSWSRVFESESDGFVQDLLVMKRFIDLSERKLTPNYFEPLIIIKFPVCEDLLLFSVSCHYKVNIFEFRRFNRRSHFKMSLWARLIEKEYQHCYLQTSPFTWGCADPTFTLQIAKLGELQSPHPIPALCFHFQFEIP